MLNSKKSNGSCRFSEDIVSYLYNEMQADEKEIFENHLNHCIACPDELTAFVAVSKSIEAWRDSEFAGMASPEIKVPYGQTIESLGTDASSGGRKSWRDNVRTIFEISPVFFRTATVFGCLAIFIGMGWFLIGGLSGGNETASEQTKNKSSPVLTESGSRNRAANQTDIGEPERVNPNQQSEIESNDRDNAQNDEPFDIKNESSARGSRHVISSRHRVSAGTARKKRLTRKKTANKPLDFEEIPTLTVAIQESDYDELRLTDLFKEIGKGD